MPITNHPGYSPEQRQALLDRLKLGESLSEVCREPDMPSFGTVWEWGEQDPEWADKLRRAREMGCVARADRMPKIAADTSLDPETRRLMLETEKWLLPRQSPRAYGDVKQLQMLDERGQPAKAGITIVIDGAPSE